MPVDLLKKILVGCQCEKKEENRRVLSRRRKHQTVAHWISERRDARGAGCIVSSS